MILLQLLCDKHSINCSSLIHIAKLHLINCHYSTKPFSNTLSTTYILCSHSLKTLEQLLLLTSPFNLKIGTITLRTYSTGIPNTSRTLTYLSHHLISYFTASNNQPNNSSEVSGFFPVSILFNICSPSSLHTQSTGPTSHLLPHDSNNFLHSLSFPMSLPDYISPH